MGIDPNDVAELDPQERLMASLSTAFVEAPEAEPKKEEAKPEAKEAEPDAEEESGENQIAELRGSLDRLNASLNAALSERDEPPAATAATKGRLEKLLEHDDPEIQAVAAEMLEMRDSLRNMEASRQAELEASHDSALETAEIELMKSHGFTRREMTDITARWADMIESDPRASILSLEEAAARIVGPQVLATRRSAVASGKPTEKKASAPREPEPAPVVTSAARGGGPKTRPAIDPKLSMEQVGDIAMREGAFERAFKP